jgi:hypothetical protein
VCDDAVQVTREAVMKKIILMGMLCTGCAGTLLGTQKIKFPIVDRSSFEVERQTVDPTEKEPETVQAMAELTDEERRTVRAVESIGYEPPKMEPAGEDSLKVEPDDGQPSSSLDSGD